MCAASSPGPALTTRLYAARFSRAQVILSGAKDSGRKRLYPLIVGVENTHCAAACSSRPPTKYLPTSDSHSPVPHSPPSREVKAFCWVPMPRRDSCRCQPLEKKFSRFGRHMNVAWYPLRRQICFAAVRNRTMLSADSMPLRGSNVNSHCPGPHSSSIVRRDRKSTRLNSSHVEISYAVFCLKK